MMGTWWAGAGKRGYVRAEGSNHSMPLLLPWAAESAERLARVLSEDLELWGVAEAERVELLRAAVLTAADVASLEGPAAREEGRCPVLVFHWSLDEGLFRFEAADREAAAGSCSNHPSQRHDWPDLARLVDRFTVEGRALGARVVFEKSVMVREATG
ncbi:MAG: hypothetical protein WDA71_11595 [Actinomycetota bacterium]